MYNIICYDSKGRTISNFTQWDLDQTITIKGLSLSKAPLIHFCNKNSTEALSIQSTLNESGDITAEVPNILLEESLVIEAYIFETDGNAGKTLLKISIPVNSKPKPSDYIYSDNVEYISVGNVLTEIKEFQQQIIDGTKIEVISNTDTDYKLRITINNRSIETPNLHGIKGEKGDKGDRGEQGEKGDPGEMGTPGKDGTAATVAVGTVTTGEPDTPASVTNSGTQNAAVLDFVIPKGEKGDGFTQIRTPLSLAEYPRKSNPLNAFELEDGAYEITETGWIGNGLSSRATVELFKGSIFIKYNNTINILSDISYWVGNDDEQWTDLYLPTALEVEDMIDDIKPTISENESSTASLSLQNNTSNKFSTLASLDITFPSTFPDDFECELIFESGETATALSYPADVIKFVGDDCDVEGDFIPAANTGYEINIKNLGFNRIVARVGAF